MPLRPPRIFQFATLFGIGLSCLHASGEGVLTVKEAEYRSRWAGPQEDRSYSPQFFAPDGGLYDEEASIQEDSPDPISGFVRKVDTMANNLKRGLRFGPLDLSLGLTTGWEY